MVAEAHNALTMENRQSSARVYDPVHGEGMLDCCRGWHDGNAAGMHFKRAGTESIAIQSINHTCYHRNLTATTGPNRVLRGYLRTLPGIGSCRGQD